jgi:hypothetical protein
VKKLKLDDLQVTSFETVSSEKQQGTVIAHETNDPDFCSHAGTCGGNTIQSACESYCTNPCGGGSDMPSCINYTCEGVTCGVMIC